jgi:hypothetical protein
MKSLMNTLPEHVSESIGQALGRDTPTANQTTKLVDVAPLRRVHDLRMLVDLERNDTTPRNFEKNDGRASPQIVESLAAFGHEFGMALQMLDDLGGLYGRDPYKRYEDLRQALPTWVWAWLATDVAPKVYHEFRREAIAETYGKNGAEALAARLRATMHGRGRWSTSTKLDKAEATNAHKQTDRYCLHHGSEGRDGPGTRVPTSESIVDRGISHLWLSGSRDAGGLLLR